MRLVQPFQHPELRMEERSYTSELEAVFLSTAQGDYVVQDSLAIVEAVVGLWESSFAAGRVLPETPETAALDSSTLAAIGRALCFHGQFVGALEVRDGELVIEQASSCDVRGSEWPWTYQLTFDTPTGGLLTRTLPGDVVLNLVIGSPKGQPWRGQSPLRRALTSWGLLAKVEAALSYEAGSPVGTLIPTPREQARAQELNDDGTPKTSSSWLDGMRTAISGLKGKVFMFETPRTGWRSGMNGQESVQADIATHKLGPQPNATMPIIREQVQDSLMAAAGVPPAIFSRSEGTAAREAFRHFYFSRLLPTARAITPELERKLGITRGALQFDFDDLGAVDIAMRMRAANSAVTMGLDVERALRIAGVRS